MTRHTKTTMRRAAQVAPALLVVSTVAAMHAAGCISTDPCDYPDLHACMEPPPVPVEKECVPSKTTVGLEDSCGVFVALAPRGKPGAAGTKEAPLASIEEGIGRAQENGKRAVYVCAEQFEETIEIGDSITLFGSLDCEDDWKWGKEGKQTVLTTDPGQVPMTMRPATGTVRIEDMKVLAAESDPNVDGQSSIAMIADGGRLDLVRCDIEAQNAAKGADGADPAQPLAESAPPGTLGTDGKTACSANVVTTEDPVPNDCGTPDDKSDDSVGGLGGPGISNGEVDGLPGDPDRGFRENAGTHLDDGTCSPVEDVAGSDGSSGTSGISAGEEAEKIGTISSTGYTGVFGTDGTKGSTAQGGGGGAGAKGSTSECVGQDGNGGASGGNGGSGGCGGQGGKGGHFGGSSIALISLDATVSFENVALKAGNGGKGGDGEPGQPGGAGGPGGDGGRNVGDLSRGCNGGKGGKGGDGGHGGGGLGGHSLGIAYVGQRPPPEGRTISFGEAGINGNRGPEATTKTGRSVDVLLLPRQNGQ
ncbi:hypothetical protein WME89_10645 [Sorangium sp. So ce321]|uniref:hypothetical protein n=1 Tax=Sorangium sp. So ce321 TaxID=3133300 RepID=UPI003F5F7E39